MKQDTYVVSNWKQQAAEVAKQSLASRYHYYKEFRESYCDMFSFWDFEHYAEKTGLQVETLRHLAKYSSTYELYKESTREAHLISRILGTEWRG